jgi:N-terminal domain of toast_rack, DUF2154
MGPTKRKIIALAAVAAIAGGLAGGVAVSRAHAVDDPRTETASVGLGGATAARVAIELGLGELTLRGGGGPANLAEAAFTYNVDDWRPEVAYEVVGDRGTLDLRQPDDDTFFRWWREVENRWDVRLNDRVPTELDVTLGVGDGELRLAGLELTRLDLTAGVGDATVDLSGQRTRDLAAAIETGVGAVTLVLPRDVGVRVEVERGLGEVAAAGLREEDGAYVNPAYGASPVTVEVVVTGGAGDVTLELAP